MKNSELTIYNVMEDKSVRTVELELETEIPDDAGFHLSADAKHLCIRNYSLYIFVDANSGNELWAYNNNYINGQIENHIIWMDFINDYQMIGIHRKKKAKSIFTLDVSRNEPNKSAIMTDLEFKNFVFDYQGKG